MRLAKAKLDEISGSILDSGIRLHSRLGPGLLESAYELCLAHELRRRGHEVRCQVPQSIRYDDEVLLENCYRIDLLVDEAVVVELKTVERLAPVHEAQLLSYLVMSGYRLGLLLNFRVAHLRDGIRRLVNRL